MTIMKVIIKLAFLAYFATIIRAELKLLSVVFRHGDRVPDNKGVETYPNDPYAMNHFIPWDLVTGKVREYLLGRYLREQYEDFLGLTYYSGIVNARSTFVERTRQCLELVLAALFIPTDDQTWDPNVNWQPIPTTFIPPLDDVLMNPQECPRFLEALAQVIKSPEYQEKERQFVPLMKNLTIATGETVNTTVGMYFLYHGLTAINDLNLELQQWTNGIYPNGQLYDGALLQYELLSYTDELNRLNGGMHLRKIIDDMTDSCEDRLKGIKIFLYSGHEFNIAAVLLALDTFEFHIPKFSSAVIVELHKQDHECFIMVKYYKGFVSPSDEDQSIEEVMTIPGCSAMCPFSEFKQILENHIATDNDIKSCDKRSIPEVIKTHKNLPSDMIQLIINGIEQENKKRYTLQ